MHTQLKTPRELAREELAAAVESLSRVRMLLQNSRTSEYADLCYRHAEFALELARAMNAASLLPPARRGLRRRVV